MTSLTKLNPQRLFPAEPAIRALAEELYDSVKDLPIVSPHGHVDPQLLLKNEPFKNPADLFIFFDHYVTRLLHAQGFELAALGKGATDEVTARAAWRILCSNWHLLAGTNSGYWLTHEFATLFGIDQTPSAENASELYEIVQRQIELEEFLPRSLFTRFNISFLATTDDPCDDLAAHKALAADLTFGGRVAPTFRPDAYLDPRSATWRDKVANLIASAGLADLTYENLMDAFRIRRDYFIEAGAVSVDVGVLEPYTTDLTTERAAELFAQAVSGIITAPDAREFAGFMLFEQIRMSAEDGLVLTLHAGVIRNHSTETVNKFGPDTGHDIPVAVEFVNNLRPALQKFGLNKNLNLILFSIDETTWSREVAPLAGFYPAVFIGAPWWFLDAPDSLLRFRVETTEIAGFYRGSGFIDDTRAFLSIPARHDMARRVDCSFLARLVVEGRITSDQARTIAADLVGLIPRKAFKL
jgi:glucuronate isomerase